MKKIKNLLITTALITAIFSCTSTKIDSTQNETAESTTMKENTKETPLPYSQENEKLEKSDYNQKFSKYDKFYEKDKIPISNLKCFQEGYPHIIFDKQYDKSEKDWIVTITVPEKPGKQDPNGKKFQFYWCNGKLLPKSELENQDKYWSLLTYYPKELLDPKVFTKEIVEDILKLGSNEARLYGKGTPMFFFDAIYDSYSQKSTEKHIARLPFINRWINVHEFLEEPLNRVSEKMWAASKTDKDVYDFIYSIKVYEAYSWREITGTNRKSFHGLGAAIDAMPRNMNQKQIFWRWTKRWNPETWPIIPLKNRWIPPTKVIEILESEGFAWGGKWVLFDNMHVEYRPELLIYNNIK